MKVFDVKFKELNTLKTIGTHCILITVYNMFERWFNELDFINV